MKYTELKKRLDEDGVRPIYLFEGEEGYFRAGGVESVCSRFVLDKTLDYASFDGGQLKGDKLKSLISAVEAFPFLSEKRVVRVTEFYPTEKEYDGYLKGFFDNPPQSSVLLIVNSVKGKKDGAKHSEKPNVTYVDCGRADEETIKKWIYVTAKRAGVYADGVTCGKIADSCVLDMSRISKETEKLLTYCRVKGINRITDELVEEIVYPDSEYKIYELSGALARRNYSAFCKIAQDLKSKGFDELALLSSLCYHFRDVYDCAVTTGSDKEAAALLSLREFAVKKNREQAVRMGEKRAKECYSSLYSLISGVKSGAYTPVSAWKTAIVELFFGE